MTNVFRSGLTTQVFDGPHPVYCPDWAPAVRRYRENPRQIPWLWGVFEPDDARWGPVVMEFTHAYERAESFAMSQARVKG